MTRSRSTRLTAALLAAFSLSACSLSTIPVPAELSAVPKMPAHGRQGWAPKRTIRFGPYETAPVRRTPAYVDVREGALSTRADHEQDYSFELMQDSVSLAYVECRADATTTAIDLPVIGEVNTHPRSGLDCDIEPAFDDAGLWRLDIAASRRRDMRGTLEGEEGTFEVVGTRDLDGWKYGPGIDVTGFYIRREGRTVAAVEIVNDGGVWIRGEGLSEDEHAAVAGAAAALLAYTALGDDWTRDS